MLISNFYQVWQIQLLIFYSVKFVDSVMEKDDETSLADLKSQLQKEGTSVSTSTVHRWRQDLGWTSKYQILSNDSRGERREALGMGTEECGRH